MATRSKATAIPALATLHGQAVTLVASVLEILGRATDTYRAFALVLVLMRGAKNPDGSFAFPVEIDGKVVADWTGSSQAYKDATAKVYADAGITDKAVLRRVQSTVRNHVSDIAREQMTLRGINFALYGLDEDSQKAKQAKAVKARTRKVATANPTATIAAVTDHLLDAKNGDPVRLLTEIHNSLVTFSKGSFALDKASDLSALLRRISTVALQTDSKLTGAKPASRSTRKSA